jgi:hypothetical protein
MLNILKDYPSTLVILSGLSVVVFLLSLLSVPWMVCRIPEDFFLASYTHRERSGSRFARGVTAFLKNLLGLGFFLLGVTLLFIPGQGILTIFLGVILMDFPGKKKVIERLVGMEKIRTSLNWIRKKRQVKPLRFPIS